jgi:hypothetical protein
LTYHLRHPGGAGLVPGQQELQTGFTAGIYERYYLAAGESKDVTDAALG